MIITLLLSCIFLIILHHCLVHYRRDGRLFDQIPGKQSLPLIGDLLDLSFRSSVELWDIMHDRLNTYYPVTKIWSFFTAYVGTRHPDDAETLLNNTKHIEKAYIYKFLQPWLKTGILTSTGSKWHKRRKILTSAFHFHILKEFFGILVEEGNRMTESLKNTKETTVENLMSFISHHTLNIICETAMGTSLHVMGEEQQQYREAVKQMGKIYIYRLMRPWLHIDFIFFFSSMYKIQRKNLEILHGFAEKIIAERKCYHERTGGQYLVNLENDSVTKADDMEVIGIRKKRLAMLDLLIAAARDNNLSDLDIREEVDTFMFEGHDTVAIAACFSLLLLAEHKDIQDRARNEVHAVMQENGGKLTMAALSNLVYLERCLKESLRLYPSVPFIARKTADDVKIQKYTVPLGASILLNIYELHRDPKFWPNPDVFDPDRFLPENINRHPYSYIPFSAGSRNCIGQRFAMMELKTMVAELLYNFQLEPVDYLKDFRFSVDIILRLTHPIRMKFVPIERSHPIETNSD